MRRQKGKCYNKELSFGFVLKTVLGLLLQIGHRWRVVSLTLIFLYVMSICVRYINEISVRSTYLKMIVLHKFVLTYKYPKTSNVYRLVSIR